MKTTAIFLFIFIAELTYSQYDITGSWRGAAERLGSIQIIELEFFQQADSLVGIYSIPDMGLYEDPLSNISFSGTKLSFKFSMGKFDAIYDTENDEITGENKNWNPAVNIDLKRWTPSAELFTKEFVRFANGNNVTAGTLLKPAGREHFPAVILIHGAEQPTTRRNWRYRYFAYLLARNGYGALMYDKQGNDSSTGNRNADLYELAEDVNSAVQYLKTRNDVEQDKIGIMGLSRGGWVAEIASNKYRDINFMILFVGPSVSTWKQELDAVKYQMLKENYSSAQVDSALAHTNLYFETVKDTSKWNDFYTSVNLLRSRQWAMYLQLPDQLNDSDMVWWRNNYYDPANDLQNTKIPVLSIFGEEDVYVPPAENESLMNEYLKKAGTEYTIKVVPRLPHNIHYNQTLKGEEWKWPGSYWVWPKKSLLLEKTVIDFLKKYCGG